MHALHRLAYRLRAMRIDRLRAKRGSLASAIKEIEGKQSARLGAPRKSPRKLPRKMATRTRPPVPEFLRRGRA